MKTFSDAQLLIDTRAVEIAAGVQERQILHEEECRDRYVRLDTNIDGLKTLLIGGLAGVVVLLITGMAVVVWDKVTERDQRWQERQTPYTQQGPPPESPPPSAWSPPKR